MEYFCQFFASGRDVARIYLATGDERYREIAEDRLGRPLLRLFDFASEDFAAFSFSEFRMISSGGFVCASDASRNYLKMSAGERALEIEQAHVADVEAFSKLWAFINDTFCEIVAGLIVVASRRNRASLELPSGKCVDVPLDGFAVYGGGVYTLCDNPKCRRYVL